MMRFDINIKCKHIYICICRRNIHIYIYMYTHMVPIKTNTEVDHVLHPPKALPFREAVVVIGMIV